MSVRREVPIDERVESQQSAVLVGVEIPVERGEDASLGLRQFPSLGITLIGIQEDVACVMLFVRVAAFRKSQVKPCAKQKTEEKCQDNENGDGIPGIQPWVNGTNNVTG